MMLQGKRAFITGSFQGIGLGIATALASEGASIVLHGIADEKAMTKAEKIVLESGADNIFINLLSPVDKNQGITYSKWSIIHCRTKRKCHFPANWSSHGVDSLQHCSS